MAEVTNPLVEAPVLPSEEQNTNSQSAQPKPSARAIARQRQERLVEGIITAAAFTGIAALVLILVFVAREALPILIDHDIREEISFDKLFTPQFLREGKPWGFMWQPVSKIPKISVVPLLIGTLKVTVFSMFIAVPLGVGAAVYASEFAPRKLREALKPIIEMLAGIPSVVLGFFALMVLASAVETTFGLKWRLNALVAALTLAIALVPVIFTVAEDALTAVPRAYREGSLALGATRWETAWRVVLPAAAPGVLAACILGFGRAIGETMIVLMVSGNAAVMSFSPTESARTLSATIAAEMGEVVVGSGHYALLFFLGVMLFFFTFIINLFAGSWTKRWAEKMAGVRA